MVFLLVAIGFIILLAGRPTYAVFVGGVGFITGFYLAGEIAIVQSNMNTLVYALLFSAFGGLGAYLFRRWAVRLAGFIAGFYLAQTFPQIIGSAWQTDSLLIPLISGGACLLLLIVWFEIPLILLSTFTGATLIMLSMTFGNVDNIVMFFILTVFGIITQVLILQYGQPSPD
jgi:hypothetical protein